jgi:hypothetical protein
MISPPFPGHLALTLKTEREIITNLSVHFRVTLAQG